MLSIKNSVIFLLLTIGFLFFACSLISMEELLVNCSVGEKEDYFNDDYITIVFSIEPKRNVVEKLFQLKEKSLQIAVDFVWNENMLMVKPTTNWKKGVSYQIRLQGEIYTHDNRIYPVYLQRQFIYGNQNSGLRLLKTFPQDSDLVQKDESIVLYFNKMPLINSFEQDFSLSPAVDVSIDYVSSEKLVKITPKNGWTTNTMYTLRLNSVVSEDGYMLDKPCTQIFYAPQDTIIPQLVGIYPVLQTGNKNSWREDLSIDGNIREKQAIGFVFNKAMDIETLRSGISFEPNLEGYIQADPQDNRRYIFYPEQSYKLSTRYEIRIASSVTDLSRLPLFEDIYTYFTSSQDFLQVVNISFDGNIIANSFPSQNISHTIVSENDKNILDVRIVFSTTVGEINKKRVMDSISVKPFFPSTINAPILESVTWNASGNTIFIRWNNFTPSKIEKNQYKILIRGGENGIINESGEYLQEDIWLIFTAL